MNNSANLGYQILATGSVIEETERLRAACRLCLTEEPNESVSIFDKDEVPGLKYSEILMHLANVFVCSNDKLPKQICLQCARSLSQFYRFKQRCELSECTLSALLLVTASPKIEETLVKEVEQDNDEDFEATSQIPMESGFHGDEEQIYGDEEHIYGAHFDVTSGSVPVEISSPSGEQEEDISGLQPPIHQCQQCGQIFTRKASLNQHLTIHSNEKRFSCELCSQRFTRKSHVTLHMRRHTNVKPYVCDICKAGFIKSGDLCRHKRIHSDRRDFICEVCGTAFKRSSDVRSHMNTHTGHKPYKCRKCPKSYTSHSSMMKHCRKYEHL